MGACTFSSKIRPHFSATEIRQKETLCFLQSMSVIRSILTTAPIENHNRKVYKKPDFMIGDAVPDTNQQLLAGEGQ